MSSIVKARLLYEMPAVKEYNKLSIDTSRQEAEDYYTDEFNEKRDNIIRQAVKKSQHIETEATERANSLVDGAIKNSRKIMMDAEQKGYDKGYHQGLIDGAKATEKKAEAGLEEIRELVDIMHEEQQATMKKQEKDLVLLSIEVAKKIMRQQIKIDEDTILKMLEETIQDNDGVLKVYLSEYQKTLDFHIHREMAKKIRSLSKNLKVVMVKEEDTIMIETENGVIDISVPVQVEKLQQTVTQD